MELIRHFFILEKKGGHLMEIQKKQLNSLGELADMGLEIQPAHACYQHRLHEYMKKKHYKASDLASLTGMPRQNISAILNYKVSPSIVIALKIATILDCRVDDLFTLDPDAWTTKAKIDKKSLFIDHLTLTIVDTIERSALEQAAATQSLYVNIQTKEAKPKEALSTKELKGDSWRPRFEPLVHRLTPLVARK
mgnify:CR=1 FL=1